MSFGRFMRCLLGLFSEISGATAAMSTRDAVTADSWLEPWIPVDCEGSRRGLEAELSRELAPGHPLFGIPVIALGKRQDQDDVRFALPDGRVAEVHLTWVSQGEVDARWPSTAFHPFLAAWAGQSMQRDHAEHIGG